MLGASFTVNAMFWDAGPVEAVSVTAMEYWPPDPTAGVPLMDSAQSKQSSVPPVKYERPFGRVLTLTVLILLEIPNSPAVPTVKVVTLELVITGVSNTVTAYAIAVPMLPVAVAAG